MNTGITIRMNGNTWLTRIQPMETVRTRLRKRASAYAAGSAITVVMTAVATATIRELSSACGTWFCRSAVAKLASVQSVGNSVGSSVVSSAGDLNAVENSQSSGKPRKTTKPASAAYWAIRTGTEVRIS